MLPNIDPEQIGNQSLEYLEINPRLVGLAESVLQQNAAILQINMTIVAHLLSQVLVMKTEIVPRDGNNHE